MLKCQQYCNLNWSNFWFLKFLLYRSIEHNYDLFNWCLLMQETWVAGAHLEQPLMCAVDLKGLFHHRSHSSAITWQVFWWTSTIAHKTFDRTKTSVLCLCGLQCPQKAWRATVPLQVVTLVFQREKWQQNIKNINGSRT